MSDPKHSQPSQTSARPQDIAQTFITKYKPHFVKDFHFDDTFKSIISSILTMPRIHMLFIGNTDSCKTTFLYAFLREYYGLSEKQSFPDNILFINNLKEQGINYYRNEMKIFCQSYSNIHGKKKIVVIDDIDAINEQSQQVFRNYIDKYGHNVHIIATCSSLQKVIESIQSRLQFIRLPQLHRCHLQDLMIKICKQENL